MNSRISFYCNKDLPPKKVSEYDKENHNHKLQTHLWHHEEEPHNNSLLEMKKGVQEFHRMFVSAPVNKAANNVVSFEE